MQVSSKLLLRTAIVLMSLLIAVSAYVAISSSQEAEALSSSQWTTVRDAVRGYIAAQVQYSADGEAGFTMDRATLKSRIDSNGDMSPTGSTAATTVTGVLGEGDDAANAPVIVDNLFTTANVIPGTSVRCNWSGSYGVANCFDADKVSEIAGRVNAHQAAGFSTDIAVYCATGRTESVTVGGLGPLAQTGALGGSTPPRVLAYKWGRNGWTGTNTTTSATTGATGAGTAPGSWVGFDSLPSKCDSYVSNADVVRCAAQWAIVSGVGDPAWGGSGYNHSNGITTISSTQQVIDIRTPSPSSTIQVAGGPTTRKIPIEHLFDSQLGYMSLGTSVAKNVIVGRTMHLPLIASTGAVMLGYDSTAYAWGVNSWNTSLAGESYQTGGLDTPLYPTQTATGSNETSAIDQTAPTFESSSATATGQTTADIARNASEPATTKIDLAGSDGHVVNYNDTILNDTETTTLTGLHPGVTYSGTLTIYDGQANSSSTPISFTTETPNTAPVVTVPADMTVEAAGPAGTAVTYSASATDAEDGVLTPVCGPPSGSTFPLGTTTVSCTVTDSGGLPGSASFNVTVQDTTSPILNVPADITVAASDPGGIVVSFLYDASDTVDTAVVASCTPDSGSLFAVGTTVVGCTASDDSGNSAGASFTVTVTYTPPCVPAKPTLGIGPAAPFWASYADYTAGLLSVTYPINNSGATNAVDVQITASSATNGVIAASGVPSAAVAIAAGGTAPVTVVYSVPLGVGGFKTTNSASAKDECGTSYTYGAPLS